MRERRGLTQGDIPGLSERQVRRLENEESRLTLAAARKLAAGRRQGGAGSFHTTAQGPNSAAKP